MLAIGIVVDDAIVVVEAVEHNMVIGYEPERGHACGHAGGVRGAGRTALVLMAVFLPVAFIAGISGRMFQQFALTIAVSVGISASMPSPSARPQCLAPQAQRASARAARDVPRLQLGLDRTTTGYLSVVRLLIRRLILVGLTLGLVVFGASRLLAVVPRASCPTGRKVFIVDVSLPPGALVAHQ